MRPNRRLGALMAAAGAALVVGAAVGADDPPPAKAPAPAAQPVADGPQPERERPAVERLPLHRLAGAVVIMRFTGATAPAYVPRALRAGRAAGVILFRDNAPSPGALRALTGRLQRAGRGRSLISIDQEGGAIRNLPWAAPGPGQPAVSRTSQARALARAAARDLRRGGVNVNLAPVADLGGPGTVMRGRAFPGGPAQVARLTAAAVRGYRDTRVAPTVKHFPGLGAATTNTDDAPAAIRRPAGVIGAGDLPPFRAAIAARVPLVMLSHARYPALDPHAIASQSRAIVHGLLKRRLGFGGVAVTDSLEAEAVRAAMGPEQAAVRSIRAGIDLILTTGPGSHLRVWRALMAEARRDRAFRARLVDAATRVRALQRSLARTSG